MLRSVACVAWLKTLLVRCQRETKLHRADFGKGVLTSNFTRIESGKWGHPPNWRRSGGDCALLTKTRLRFTPHEEAIMPRKPRCEITDPNVR